MLHADDDRELRLVLAVAAEEGLAHLVRVRVRARFRVRVRVRVRVS